MPIARGLVYNFNIGDVFNYEIFDVQVERKANTSGSYEQITVLNKKQFSNSIKYTLKREKHVSKKVTEGTASFETEGFQSDKVEAKFDKTQELYAGLPGG